MARKWLRNESLSFFFTVGRKALHAQGHADAAELVPDYQRGGTLHGHKAMQRQTSSPSLESSQIEGTLAENTDREAKEELIPIQNL
jgi:hypothetical protein